MIPVSITLIDPWLGFHSRWHYFSKIKYLKNATR